MKFLNMMIASNCRALREKFEGMRTGEWCDPVIKMSHEMKKRVDWGGDWAREV